MCRITDNTEEYHSHPENQGGFVWMRIEGEQQNQSAAAPPGKQHPYKEVKRRKPADPTTMPSFEGWGL